ncbi:C40 family peptidase [Arthrobacter koreensis]|uniref:C40 family peptidase n=1 Tax=Arthrobacter koreensis TaxID=199136 RepID=A0ABY6FV03_9MICC|nr:C40 family peptidase [Arthrobacter koreensis]MEB7447836.1 C40 family peptidase [Arthrobacter koreensis]UYB36566.1 C40 family peptidase [Arthrobacter koreensis]
MSMTDAIGRIQEIRSTIDALSGTPAAKVSTAASSTTGTPVADSGGAGFAATLSALTGTTSSLSDGATNEALMGSVEKYLGLPYIWGGNDPAVGLDCSSFVQNVFKDLGYTLPRVTWDQMNAGTKVDSMAQAQPGDLLFTHDGGHVSIYLGNGKVVDAPQPGQTIQIRDAWETDANITTIRRILPAESTASGTGSPAAAAAITDMVASARAMQASLMGAGA